VPSALCLVQRKVLPLVIEVVVQRKVLAISWLRRPMRA
jgi:hypothetical protein